MQIVVNGKPEEVAEGATVGSMVSGFKLVPRRVAVEVNRELVSRDTYDHTELHEGDRVEIVTFVGGG
jgi:sulfur carrier protein